MSFDVRLEASVDCYRHDPVERPVGALNLDTALEEEGTWHWKQGTSVGNGIGAGRIAGLPHELGNGFRRNHPTCW